ncbi:MAG TPA: winged helix-turn-helix domain-containing tetratricopeptide repeat protein [Devosia sp.]|nr:winged helix-turn-helix domain-containing tetratricopeptide repeat protein [Devosia sp.]
MSSTFGPFALDRRRAALTRDGADVAIGHKGYALLEALFDAGGETVGKAALMERAWPGTIVEEGNLTVQIAALRKALGEDADSYIVTVPRVGYRLAVPPPPEAAPGRPLVAVLPFNNMSGDQSQEYFADGIVEDIITALSRFRSFAVIARNSSFVYKGRAVDVRQVARELGVRYVLEGSVRLAGDRLRVTAQLIDADSGSHLWADKFDGRVAEVFDMQDRITESVVTIVEPRIRWAEIDRSRRERPGSLAAYDLYLRAIPRFVAETPADNEAAYDLFCRAIALDPHYAPALSLAAGALTNQISMGWPPLVPNNRARCIELMEAALLHGSDDATVLARCSTMLIHSAHDYDRGMQMIARALDVNPNNITVLICAGIVHLHCGSVEAAIGYARRALTLSPGDSDGYFSMTTISHANMILGDYAKALEWAERAQALNPRNNPTHWMLIAANAQLGRMTEARRRVAEFHAMVPQVTIASIVAGQPGKDPARLAAVIEGLRMAGMAEGGAV